ncbi:MAG: hypothetical protein AAFW73_23765 [Bacteroidota bacterium]
MTFYPFFSSPYPLVLGLLLILLNACQDPQDAQSAGPAPANTIAHPKELTYHFNLQGKRQSFTFQYVEDSLFFREEGVWRVENRDIRVSPVNRVNSLSDQMIQELSAAFVCGIRNRIANFKQVLHQEDLDFDNNPDLYFVDRQCFAANTHYRVYVYRPREDAYFLSEELSALPWSRIAVNPPRKRFDLYQQSADGRETVSYYRLDSQGKLIPLIRAE